LIYGLLLGVAGLGYLSTGWTVVAPGEAVVVRRLGRVLPRPWGPGVHFGGPVGIDRVTRVRTDEVRRLTVGLAGTPGARDEPGAGEFLTGDLNLLRAEATVQYRVADPVKFTLCAEGVEPLLRRLAEASLSRALARQGVDATLREGRAAAAREAEAALALGAGRYGLGVSVLGFSLTDARPPSEVAADFAAAQSARSDHDRRVNEANTYAASTVTQARALAGARLEQARARADRSLALARSRAGRFVALLAEADKSRALTVRRLYLDTLRELLPRVRRKLVLTPDEPLDLSILGSGR
jgi:membrane protease subunit HflK